ncbi:MAG: hypothetical protein M1839_008544 [Geoglossum umbratile]|nr:MAG: hypothetical protein M1839_008544 [Geoglossum umbratile]
MVGATRHYLVVGVDFGTTYTGVNYGLSKYCDDSDIAMIQDWPTGILDTTEHGAKAPTQIAYEADMTGQSKWCWGYQIKPGTVRYAWMKLLLDKHAVQTAHDDPGLKSDIEKGAVKMPDDKSAQDVAADFLKEVYDLTMKRLRKDYRQILDLTPIKFWFTMPAIWSDGAQVGTLAAAKKAGFGSRKGDEICMVAEPEAAALATLSSPTLSYCDQLELKDGVLICDCGGGTVEDLTSYTILDDDPLELAESCVGEELQSVPKTAWAGGKCGGTSVDRDIVKLLSERFLTAFDPLDHGNVGPGSQFMQDFDWNKRNFGKPGFKLKPLAYYLKNEQNLNPSHYDKEESCIILADADMIKVFDPVVKKITGLVEKQVKAARTQGKTPIKDLILVGGFGDSPYLRQKLGAWCGSRGIRMRVPGDSWGAVVKGAVIRGLEMATVVRRKCRRHYGTIYSKPFETGVDKESESYICRFTKARMAPGYMSWPINRGEDVVLDTFKALPFYHVLEESQRTITVKLQSCNLDNAPTKYGDGVEDMGEIVTNLTGVDFSRFECKTEDGKKIYKFDYQLEVVLGHKQGTIYFRVRALDEIIGQTSVDFSK